jgi:uncharacterized protein YwqG
MSAFLIAAAFVALVAIFGRRHWRVFKSDIADVWRQAKDEWDEGVANTRARENMAEEEQLIAWYCSLARPALLLSPAQETPPGDAAAWLGGPVWFADGETWPSDEAGLPLECVAQLDFGALPPLPGFPAQGVARVFVGRDDVFGANFDKPDRSAAMVLWHDGPRNGGRLEPALALTSDDGSPFMDERHREAGMPLAAERIDDLPDAYDWRVRAELAKHNDSDALEDRLYELAEARPAGHRIGGYPSFTQYDFREPGKNDNFDVTLLALTSDDTIMWGDVGEAMFLIRSEDLARRDFSRVAFYWDCH